MLLHLKTADLLLITEPDLLTRCAWQSHAIHLSTSLNLNTELKFFFLFPNCLLYYRWLCFLNKNTHCCSNRSVPWVSPCTMLKNRIPVSQHALLPDSVSCDLSFGFSEMESAPAGVRAARVACGSLRGQFLRSICTEPHPSARRSGPSVFQHVYRTNGICGVCVVFTPAGISDDGDVQQIQHTYQLLNASCKRLILKQDN